MSLTVFFSDNWSSPESLLLIFLRLKITVLPCRARSIVHIAASFSSQFHPIIRANIASVISIGEPDISLGSIIHSIYLTSEILRGSISSSSIETGMALKRKIKHWSAGSYLSEFEIKTWLIWSILSVAT